MSTFLKSEMRVMKGHEEFLDFLKCEKNFKKIERRKGSYKNIIISFGKLKAMFESLYILMPAKLLK